MKLVGEVTACICDYGTFSGIATRLARDMKKVYLYQPFEAEYLNIKACIEGYGLDNIEQIDHPLDPDHVDEIDLYVFPDRGYGQLQKYLRDHLHKAVWGSMGFCEYEEYRTRFLDLLQEVGRSESVV